MTSPLPAGRAYQRGVSIPVTDPNNGAYRWGERASIPFVRELIRRHIALPDYAKARFQGSRAQQAMYWREYRNYINQAISYFDAAVTVADRSACLLYYYALMNFAKAELLDSHSSQVFRKRIHHGLS